MQTPYLCSISDAATALGIGRTKTYEMLNSGELESIQIGTRRLVKLDSIKAFIENASGGAA
ncbi:MAG: helix-turn-helix domain-containing protein [Sphingomonadales bacterium]|nr:helix-turn-helix domain-containing protein [Sphingomonadales bacterium]MBK9005056.1 helix-turn-helix domain-containing protein [Sphingomonadales bacterium]MBK9267210.1 helix-turn-helix domain-containing protein [Sphingomonadales bacterium]